MGHQADAAASPPLTFADPAGDNLDKQANTDVVSVSFEVKTLKAGEPPKLIVSMTLAGPPADRLVTYSAGGELAGCESLTAAYRPGAVVQTQSGQSTAAFSMSCGAKSPAGGEFTSIPVRIQIKGKTITWAVAVDSLPKDARSGAPLTDLSGSTETTEPVFGIFGNALVKTTDEATTDKQFRFV
ncbi:MAG TPA: hypothetical protein VM347_28265 [Nonomuraea sp.]|nr:hypothetical protein [Nonomuraea sp.]